MNIVYKNNSYSLQDSTVALINQYRLDTTNIELRNQTLLALVEDCQPIQNEILRLNTIVEQYFN